MIKQEVITSDKLKSCPCCGGRASVVHITSPWWVFRSLNAVCVVCSKCGVRTQGQDMTYKLDDVPAVVDGLEEVINIWNKRA